MYLAKDYDGEVWLYNKEPIKDVETGMWMAQADDSDYPFCLTDDDIANLQDELREISWDDKEPRKVILVAKPEGIASSSTEA